MKRLAAVLALAAVVACGKGEAPAPAGTPAPVKTDPPGMPPTGHRVEWGTPGVPCMMKAGSTVYVSVVVKNKGDQFWHSSKDTATGRGAVRLGARWWSPRDAKLPVVEYFERGDLANALGPEGTATLTVKVKVPDTPGSYQLQMDLVEELIVWFENKGAPRLMVPVTVN